MTGGAARRPECGHFRRSRPRSTSPESFSVCRRRQYRFRSTGPSPPFVKFIPGCFLVSGAVVNGAGGGGAFLISLPEASWPAGSGAALSGRPAPCSAPQTTRGLCSFLAALGCRVCSVPPGGGGRLTSSSAIRAPFGRQWRLFPDGPRLGASRTAQIQVGRADTPVSFPSSGKPLTFPPAGAVAAAVLVRGLSHAELCSLVFQGFFIVDKRTLYVVECSLRRNAVVLLSLM